ncbi:MAG: hypothetical protein DRQ40_05030 [Gammaproteobacteria bacterium]|nr:MAG: hypothetical protein DRQ40_05030 [Gammaproteobacteria bacterium]
MTRSISKIAMEIRDDWKKIHYSAAPYLQVMLTLDSADDVYITESARNIIRYFLSNAKFWRGDKAKEIKTELRNLIK